LRHRATPIFPSLLIPKKKKSQSEKIKKRGGGKKIIGKKKKEGKPDTDFAPGPKGNSFERSFASPPKGKRENPRRPQKKKKKEKPVGKEKRKNSTIFRKEKVILVEGS